MRRDIEEIVEEFIYTDKSFLHSIKLVPQSQRDLFASELESHLKKLIQSYADQRVKEALEEVAGIVDGMEKPINISDPIPIQKWAHGYHQALTDLTTTLRQKIDDISSKN